MANPLPMVVREAFETTDINVIYALINRRNRTLRAAPEYVRIAMLKALRSGARLGDLQREIDQFYGRAPHPARVFLQDRVFRRTAQVWSETEALVDQFAATVARLSGRLRTVHDREELQRGANVLSLCHDELMMLRGQMHRVSR